MPIPSLLSARAAAACALVLVLAACESPSDNAPPVAARMDVLSGDAQEATAGTELSTPLVARVVDAKGRPVPGQIVNFRVVSGGGSVFAGTGETNANGEVRERWKLGTSTAPADSQRVEARAVDAATGAALVFANFRATAKPDAPATFAAMGAVTRAGGAGGAVADSLAVRVADRYGNPIAGVEVAWAARDSGSVSPATSRTDASGVARAAWTLGRAMGTQSASGSAAGFPAVAFTATVGAGAPARVTILPRELRFSTISRETAVTVGAVDAFGNPIAAAAVTLVSLDASVATLTGSRVQARGSGATRLVATLQGSGLADTVEIRVEQVAARIEMSPAMLGVMLGDTGRIRATASDSAGFAIANPRFTWRSSNQAVLTVDAAGVARGVSLGTSLVTVQSGAAQDLTTLIVYSPLFGVDVAPTFEQGCALDRNGAAYCWGRQTNRIPAPVEGGRRFASLARGQAWDHTCALDAAGAAYCWGDNTDGELGDGTTTRRSVPTPVAGGITFTQLAISGSATCGVAANGTVYCWGNRGFGQLGDGSEAGFRATPAPVAGSVSFRSIAAGIRHFCGVATDGRMYCWGMSSFGQAGAGESCETNGQPCVKVPTVVREDSRFTAVAAGTQHSCGLRADGGRVCWGNPEAFGAATGTSPGFASLTAGSTHTCGLTPDGEAFCWGLGGGLGTGGPTQATSPAPVAGGHRFTRLTAGGGNTCGVARDGAILCWGQAPAGTASRTDQATPGQVVHR